MSGLVCPHCSKTIDLFKSGGGKKAAQEIGVPFLNIGLDTFDRRYTPIDEMKNKISQFFTAMGIG